MLQNEIEVRDGENHALAGHDAQTLRDYISNAFAHDLS